MRWQGLTLMGMTNTDRFLRAAAARKAVTSGELWRLLAAANMTKAELARALDLTPAAVALWSSGRAAPSFDVALRLAALLEQLTELAAS